MAYPDADIYQIDESGLVRAAYEATEDFVVAKTFWGNPGRQFALLRSSSVKSPLVVGSVARSSLALRRVNTCRRLGNLTLRDPPSIAFASSRNYGNVNRKHIHKKFARQSNSA
jgi:hypothetical protein